MAYGKCRKGNKTNRMIRLRQTEVGTFRQLWSEKSLLRKGYLSRDLKCENEPSTRPERSAPEREIFEEQKRKPVWPKDLKWERGDQEVKEKSCMEGPMAREGFGYYSLEQVLSISHWLLSEITCKCIYPTYLVQFGQCPKVQQQRLSPSLGQNDWPVQLEPIRASNAFPLLWS